MSRLLRGPFRRFALHAGTGVRPPAPVLEGQEYLISKLVANHLRRPQRLPLPRQGEPQQDGVHDASARALPEESVVKHTKLASSPSARPPLFEPDTVRVPIVGQGGGRSHWPADDFTQMISEMKLTMGRFVGIPRENVRFRVSLVPLSLDTKDCITSSARPNSPPASLIANYVSEQIEGGKLRELGNKRGVSALVKEIFTAFGPHTGRRRYVKGVRISISGRLGQERAATAAASEGTLPLSTLDADVDYATRRAFTRSGIVGIKVWVVNDGVPLQAPSPSSL